MLTDPAFYAVALPAVILTGLSKGGFSGVAIAALPLMALVLPPVKAAAIMLPVLMVQDVVTVWNYRRSYDRTLLIYILPPAMLGIVLAWATAASVSEAAIRLIVGLIAVGFCLETWLSRRQSGDRKPHNRVLATALGATSGFTSFLVNAGGAPFIAYALPRVETNERLAGSAAIHFWVVNIVKLPAFPALGQITGESLTLSAVLFPMAIAANLAGIWLVRRVSAKAFFAIILWITFLVGLKLIIDAVGSMA